MAIRPVLRMGDPVLFQKARAIEVFDTPELHHIIEDMEDTMQAMNGAGIAAPQIGVGLRVVIFGVGHNPRRLRNASSTSARATTISAALPSRRHGKRLNWRP